MSVSSLPGAPTLRRPSLRLALAVVCDLSKRRHDCTPSHVGVRSLQRFRPFPNEAGYDSGSFCDGVPEFHVGESIWHNWGHYPYHERSVFLQ